MKYFKDVAGAGLTLHCRHCGISTKFEGQTGDYSEQVPVMYYQFQCQDCGEVSWDQCKATAKMIDVVRCSCKGQFRRDKPLFCPHCNGNKTAENKSGRYKKHHKRLEEINVWRRIE